jgi:transposase InsO family protein
MSHANAALTPKARLKLGRLVVQECWTVSMAARRFEVTYRTAQRWARRYAEVLAAGREPGLEDMRDRSSRPHRQPGRTPQPMVKRIVRLRWRQRLGPVEIGHRLGIAPSTVHAVLVRCRLNRLSHIDRHTGEPIRRYEHQRPGALLHVDVKKLGNIPDGGGWRYVGRAQGKRNRAQSVATGAAKRDHRHDARTGIAFVHTVLDDHSRVAYAEIHDDELATTAVAVLRRAVAWFNTRGVTIDRVISDNGSAYKSHAWRDTCAELGITPKKTRPYRPPDQRQDRTLPPHPRRLGLRPVLPLRNRPPHRPASMAPPLQPPPTPHRHRQSHPHHPPTQPDWTAHLGRVW